MPRLGRGTGQRHGGCERLEPGRTETARNPGAQSAEEEVMAHVLVECAVRGTLTAAVTAVILWATRIKTPVARHAAWTGVLLSMLLLPVWTVWGPRASMRVLPPMPAPREIVARLSGPGLHVPPANQRPLDTVDSALVQTQGRDWQRVLLGIYVV